ncbi:hypothetical protein [Alicyclobacillus fodiniaquatilis]|uniref:Copper amine oxidase N-terminal domain-containing protein n=1 Tax=Alicyclobacillus fodiniaquatilis TaxID=1661150 RepID=A0ABW4JC60_9BACL
MNRNLKGILAGLIAVGTFVPNVLAATSSSTSKQFISSITLDESVIAKPYGLVAKEGSTNTTYMPVYYLNEAMKAAGFTAKWDGKTKTWAVTSSKKNFDFSGISVGSGNTTITVNGTVVKKVNTISHKDPAGGPKAQVTTYVPIYYVNQLLSAIGVQNVWNGATHQMTEKSPLVVATGTYGAASGAAKQVSKDIWVSGNNVTLQNLNVSGDIFLDPGADGTVNLTNVTASGKIVVLSGADHSIHLTGTTANSVDVHTSTPVDVDVSDSTLGTITLTDGSGTNTVTLNVTGGQVGDVNDNSGGPVVLKGDGYSVVNVDGTNTIEITGQVQSLNITAANTQVVVDSGASVGTLTVSDSATGVALENNGTITTLSNSSSTAVDVSGTGTVTTTTGSTTGGTTPPVGGGGGGSVGPSGPPTVTLTAAEQATLAKVATELQAIHDNLTPDEMAAVKTAQASVNALTPDDIAGILYGKNATYDTLPAANEQTLVTALQSMLPLYYTSLESDISSDDVQNLYDEIWSLDNNITVDDLYNFYKDFKTDLMTQVGEALLSDQSISVTDIVSTALSSAATESGFDGLLTEYGLHVSDIPAIESQMASDIAGYTAAEQALITAAGETMFNVTQDGMHLELTFSANAPDGLSGTSVPAEYVTWSSSNPSAVAIDPTTGVPTLVTSDATTVLTATVDGFTVFSQEYTVPVLPL